MNKAPHIFFGTAFLCIAQLHGQSPLPREQAASKEASALKRAAFIFVSKAGGESGFGYIDRGIVNSLRNKLSSDFLYFRGESSSFVLLDEGSISFLKLAKAELDAEIKKSNEDQKAIIQAAKHASTMPTELLQQPRAQKMAFDKWQGQVFALIIEAMASHREVPLAKILP
jgi:hypothetical protein